MSLQWYRHSRQCNPRCILGNFEKQSACLALHSYNTTGLIMGSLSTNEPEMSLFFFHTSFTPIQSLAPTLPTMLPSYWVTSLEAIYLILCSFLWSYKRFYTIHTYDLKHTLICKLVGVTLLKCENVEFTLRRGRFHVKSCAMFFFRHAGNFNLHVKKATNECTSHVKM